MSPQQAQIYIANRQRLDVLRREAFKPQLRRESERPDPLDVPSLSRRSVRIPRCDTRYSVEGE